jgi:hypothetical protein
MASLPIPDELLVDIFLRLPTPIDLVRASAACISFRRVAVDRSFIRRYRKLHGPPLLGFLDRQKVFYPAMAPHPLASAANAVALAADFSFSFLPAPASDWVVQDVRDGRVLLDRTPQYATDSTRHLFVFPELVVCDPLHRRYLLLPPIPHDLAASVDDPLWTDRFRYCEIFLAPPGGDDEEASDTEETSFSVIWMAQCRTELVASVFSSSTGQWRAISSMSCSDLFSGLLPLTGSHHFSWRQYSYGCFYWVTDWRERLLVLDTQTMEFSIAEPPPEARGLPCVDIAIVEAGEGMPGMFVLSEDAVYLDYTIRRSNCGSSSQWQHEKTFSLDSKCSVMGAVGRNLLLYQLRNPSLGAGCFLLDVKTLQLERLLVSNSSRPYGHIYSNFPPSMLSTPAISSGKLSVAS